MLGTTRIPSTGMADPDIIAHGFAIEHKYTQNIPKWFQDYWDQAVRNKHDLKPMVVISRAGKPAQRWAVVDLKDLVELLDASDF